MRKKIPLLPFFQNGGVGHEISGIPSSYHIKIDQILVSSPFTFNAILECFNSCGRTPHIPYHILTYAIQLHTSVKPFLTPLKINYVLLKNLSYGNVIQSRIVYGNCGHFYSPLIYVLINHFPNLSTLEARHHHKVKDSLI